MRDYRTDYSNHVHLLLVSVSKHLYILKNRTLKYQKKKMDFNLKNLKKADRELVVHYLIADHLSGVFYGEIHSSKKMIPVEEFLYRAWSKKENFPFCGLPTILSVPKTIESEELLNLVSSLGIEPINPTGGFMGGVVHLKIWEDRISQFEFFYNYQHKQPLAFEGLQTFNLKICVEESQQWLQRGNSRIGEKIELWKQGLKELILPPPQKEFFSLFKRKAEKKPEKYPPVKFEVFPTEDGEEFGEFVWGKERAKIEEKYLELLDFLEHGEVRGMLKTLQGMSKEDAEFIGTYELMGHLEYGKRNLKKAIEHFRKAVEVGDRIIPKRFNGHILNDVFENKYFLDSFHRLALCYLKTGNAVGALSCLDRMVKYCPSYCTHCTLFLPEKKNEELFLIPKETHGRDSERIMSRSFKPGEGLAGWVFQHGESILTPDARDDNRYSSARQRCNLPRSMLVTPIKVGTRTIGVISAQQEKVNWFSKSDRQLVETLTRHAGIAIERALGLNIIQEIGLQLISSEEENKILQRVVTGAIELTDTTSGILYLISEDGKSIIKKFSYPPDFRQPPPRMENEKGFTRQIIKTGKMVIVPDVRKDDHIDRELLEENLRAMIGVPLKIGKKVVGVLYINAKKPRSFTETECSLLEILASQAAIAIYNSRLYQNSQRQLVETEALYETTQEIVEESINIKSVLDKILKRAVELSNADSGQILFRDTFTDEFKVVFTHKLEILNGIISSHGEGMAYEVLKTGKSVFSNDFYNSPYKEGIFNDPNYQNLFNALAEVPLKWQGEVIGILAISSNSFFTVESIRLLERFAGPAAIAIAIAREISFRKTLLNNSPNAIVTIDRKGIVKEFNKASEQIYRYTMDEMLNGSVVDLWGEEARRINQLMHNSVDGTVSHVEACVKSKGGERIPVLFSGSLLYSEDYGGEIGSIGHIEDQRIVSLRVSGK